MSPIGLDSVRIDAELTACEQCRSTSRVGRGICLNCLLHGALADIEKRENLETVLDEIDVRDADWRIGNYQILEEIGRGGMGIIYRARQRHSRRIVALKRMLSFQADSQETLVRFRREAEAAASLDHPNILPIYEVSECEEGLPFFSMKFAAGGSLVDAAAGLRKEPRRSVALMAKVARAVHYAHSHGILHRDLKPGNILLDGRGEPLVSDFGLAKWLDTSSDLTRTLTIFGTPGYIAPEQARGPAAKLTSTADVYSLGAILFELFTGRPPFLGEHALAVIQQAGEKPAPKLRSLTLNADRDLDTICAKCLEREPVARYQSAADLAHDVESWLERKPIKARRVSPPTRIWRWSCRNPKLAAATVTAFCSAMAAAFLFFSHNGFAPPTRLDSRVRAISAQVKTMAVPSKGLAGGTGAVGNTGSLTFQSQGCVTPPPDLSAWWPGDGNFDDIQGGNNGTPQGNVTFAPGDVGQAFSLSGSEYVSVNDSPSLNPTAITIDVWMKTTNSGVGASLVSKFQHNNGMAGDDSYFLGFNHFGLLQWQVDTPQGDFILNSPTLNIFDGQFHLVAATYDGSLMVIYVDGQSVAFQSATGAIQPTTTPLYLGATIEFDVPGRVARFFVGQLDEVDIFSRALTEAEIQSIFDARSVGKCHGRTPRLTPTSISTATRGAGEAK